MTKIETIEPVTEKLVPFYDAIEFIPPPFTPFLAPQSQRYPGTGNRKQRRAQFAKKGRTK